MQLKDKLLATNMFADNNYLDLYCKLIESNMNTKKIKYVTNQHHIIPKSYYRIAGINVQNKGNTVHLSYADHILAHYYLCLCTTHYDLKYCNELAFMFLIDKTKNNNSVDMSSLTESENDIIKNLEYFQKIYTEGAKKRGIKNTGKKRTEETKKKMSAWQKGVPKTKESIQKRLDKVIGRKRSEESILNWKIAMQNRTEEQKRITFEKNSKAHKGRIVSETERKHHSEALKGKPKSEEHKRKLSINKKKYYQNHPAVNTKLSEEQVLEIIAKIKNGQSIKDIANQYNVLDNCIYLIKNKRTWKYLYNKYPELNN